MFHQTIKSSSRYGAAAVLAFALTGVQPAQAQGDSPFVGQIIYGGFNFAPNGWWPCDGSLLQISQYQTLFNLIGTTYGGDGQSTFAVPDMRGRVPLHFGNGFVLAEQGGAETATLTTSQIPAHSHTLSFNAPLPAASAVANSTLPTGHVAANTGRNLTYSTSAPDVSLGGSVSLSSSGNTGSTGGSQPFSILRPYLTVTCAISLFGVFPSQN